MSHMKIRKKRFRKEPLLSISLGQLESIHRRMQYLPNPTSETQKCTDKSSINPHHPSLKISPNQSPFPLRTNRPYAYRVPTPTPLIVISSFPAFLLLSTHRINSLTQHEDVEDLGHGRVERRYISSSSDLHTYI